MKITDEMLYQHAAEARDIWLDTLPDDSTLPEHRFSDTFEREMQEAVHRSSRRRIRMKGARQAAAVALICLLAAGVWLGANSGARSTLRHWVQTSAAASFLHRCFGGAAVADYHISQLPGGMEALEVSNSGGAGEAVYEAEDGSLRTLSFTRGEAGIQPPGEGAGEAVEINGLSGLCWEEPGESSWTAAWYDETADVSFRLSGCATKEEAVRMAESVREGAAVP